MNPDAASFSEALSVAISRREQWMRPINIWLSVDETDKATGLPTALNFYASAHTVPPRSPEDDTLLVLDDTELETLAHMEDESQQYDEYVTELLSRVLSDRQMCN